MRSPQMTETEEGSASKNSTHAALCTIVSQTARMDVNIVQSFLSCLKDFLEKVRVVVQIHLLTVCMICA